MPQIAIIQPVAPQAPPPGPPPVNEETRQFSPHLDKALAKRKDQISSQESDAKPLEQIADDTKNIGNEKEIFQNDPTELKQGGEDAQGEEGSALLFDTIPVQEHSENQNNSLLLYMMAMSQAGIQPLDQSLSKGQNGNSAATTLSQHLDSNSPLFTFLSNNFKVNNDTSGQPRAIENSTEGGLLNNPIAKTTSLPLIDTPEAKLENPLLLQLQKIIANSNETGNLSITVTGNTVTGNAVTGNAVTGNTINAHSQLSSLQTILPIAVSESAPIPLATTVAASAEFEGDGPTSLLPFGSEISVEKANQNMTTTRHSIQQQYYEGKIIPQNDQDNKASLEGNQKNNTFLPNTATTVEANLPSTASPEQPNTFAQPLAILQEGQKLPTAETLRPVTLPSGTVVQQEEVIKQIAERLQISRQDLNTRVNIQLHPAELGELKISLSLKEGSVRANVVASSQYAQEIIEKNMSRLRTILESQGLTISEISVSSKSDAAGDFNLFDRQLFSQKEYTPPSTKDTRQPSALFTLDNPAVNEQPAMSGVNVKI